MKAKKLKKLRNSMKCSEKKSTFQLTLKKGCIIHKRFLTFVQFLAKSQVNVFQVTEIGQI